MKIISGKAFGNLLEKRGWILVNIKSSHHKYRNVKTGKQVIIPVHGNRDLAKGLQHRLMKETDIEQKDL